MAPFMLLILNGQLHRDAGLYIYCDRRTPRAPGAVEGTGTDHPSRLVPTTMPATAAASSGGARKAQTAARPAESRRRLRMSRRCRRKFAPRVANPGIVKYKEVGGPRVFELVLELTPDRSLAAVKKRHRTRRTNRRRAGPGRFRYLPPAAGRRHGGKEEQGRRAAVDRGTRAQRRGRQQCGCHQALCH